MTLKLRAAGRYCTYTILLGAILSIIAFIVVVTQSGFGRPSLVCAILVYLAYWKDHCALYGTGRSFIDAHASELKAYDLSKGTIRFTVDKPFRDRLMTQIVRARLAEVEKPG